MIVIVADKKEPFALELEKLFIKKNINHLFLDCTEGKYDFIINSKIKVLKYNGKILRFPKSSIFINRATCAASHPIAIFLSSLKFNQVITHPMISAKKFSKLSQLYHFNNFPLTNIYTNMSGNNNMQDYCIKSASLTPTIVKFWDKSVSKNTPTVLQKVIKGDVIKVHYVGGYIFAHKIISEKLDAKDDFNCKYVNYPIDNKTKLEVNELSNLLKLNYFDCDFIVTQKKVKYFLEVNLSPAPLMFIDPVNEYKNVLVLLDFFVKNKYRASL
jgi:hypothetical protein